MDTETTCRVCLKNTEKLVHLDEVLAVNNDSQMLPAREIFRYCTRIDSTVHRNHFPQSICLVCEYKMQRTYDFIHQALSSQETFEERLGLSTKAKDQETQTVLDEHSTQECSQESETTTSMYVEYLDDPEKLMRLEFGEPESPEASHEIKEEDDTVDSLIILTDDLSSKDDNNKQSEHFTVEDFQEVEPSQDKKKGKTKSKEESDSEANNPINRRTPNPDLIGEIEVLYFGGNSNDSSAVNDSKDNGHTKGASNSVFVKRYEDEISFDDMDLFVLQLEQEKAFKALRCENCDMKFSSQLVYNMHMVRYHPKLKDDETTAMIEQDGQSSPDKKQAKTHRKCTACGEMVPLEVYDTHYKKHQNQTKPHKCPECPASYFAKATLRGHIKRVHRPHEYLCTHCPKTFGTKNLLTIHLQIHDKNRERKWECTICGKKFISKHILGIHTRNHNKKDYPCEICGKVLHRPDSLRYHLFTHTGEGEHECMQCKRKFFTKTNLEYHMRSHTGETPYECEICGKKFQFRHRWSDHRDKHMGVTYKCTHPQCEMVFDSKKSKQEHFAAVHKGIFYKCNICMKEYTRKYRLREHMEKSHGIRVTIEDISNSDMVSPEQGELQTAIEIVVDDF